MLRSLENGLRNREVKVLIVDEAHHMFLAKDRWKQKYSFEKIKTLAIETGVVIVLLGTYDLLDVRDHSAQLVRRSEIIHFPRYTCRAKEDRANFQGAVLALQRKLPMRSIPNLLKMAGFLHLKTCGLVGILKDWLSAALEIHLVEGVAFDKALLERCAESNIGLRTIFAEAIFGETKMKDIPLEDLRSLVYAKHSAAAAPPKSEDNPKAKRPDVGVRSPKRDPVGGVHA
ncbi:MAG TPA: TniB family NTP-binding protein [Burkholderiaceae bacterium]